eukprot:351639-Chlamydomonas_euryale.AAC.7
MGSMSPAVGRHGAAGCAADDDVRAVGAAAADEAVACEEVLTHAWQAGTTGEVVATRRRRVVNWPTRPSMVSRQYREPSRWLRVRGAGPATRRAQPASVSAQACPAQLSEV